MMKLTPEQIEALEKLRNTYQELYEAQITLQEEVNNLPFNSKAKAEIWEYLRKQCSLEDVEKALDNSHGSVVE